MSKSQLSAKAGQLQIGRWATDSFDTGDALVRAVERELQSAVGAMPPRQAQIVRRCDLDGEEQRAVMRELALSDAIA